MLWQVVVPWFGEHILNLEKEITVFTNGSGDTTYNYVSLLVYAIIAGIATLAWTLWNPQKPTDKQAFKWFVVLVRYYLVFQMVLYGLAKVFYLQFQEPSFSRLLQPLGDFSPMGLLWTFMGFSMGYTIFTGIAEFLGGILLLFKKSRSLGAMIVFGVMANVMAMNFFYDVPVKLLSTHLVILSLFLLILDGKRILDFFIFNQDTEARTIEPFFIKPKAEKIKNIIKWILVGVGLVLAFGFLLNLKLQNNPSDSETPFMGLHEVESFMRNGEEVPPLITDTTRWRYLIIQRQHAARIKYVNDKTKFYDFKPDSLEPYILFNLRGDTTRTDTFFYTQPDSTHIHLSGIYNTDTLEILMKSHQKKGFQLMNRGFRWINEYPHNR